MQPRQRRRYVIDLSDSAWDFVFQAAEMDGRPPRDAILELIARGAGMEPLDAAVHVARRSAFALARAEASTLLGELGRKLTEHARLSFHDVQAKLIDEIADGRARAAEQAREAALLRGQ